MRSRLLGAATALLFPAIALAQNPRPAIYITAEQVKVVNALPGTDRQIVNADVGNTNLSVGVVHRGPSGSGGVTPTISPGPSPEPCGEKGSAPAGAPFGFWHAGQTETYIIISGSGTLATGGRIMNGAKWPAQSEITRVVNGPSCGGPMVGDDVVKRVVAAGDIIIIPAGTPHTWTDVPDHVDYLSVRPDPERTIPGMYINPALKKQ